MPPRKTKSASLTAVEENKAVVLPDTEQLSQSNAMVNIVRELDLSKADFTEQWGKIGEALKMLSQGKLQMTISSLIDQIAPDTLPDQPTPPSIPSRGVTPPNAGLWPYKQMVSGRLSVKDGMLELQLTPEGNFTFYHKPGNPSLDCGRNFVFVD